MPFKCAHVCTQPTSFETFKCDDHSALVAAKPHLGMISDGTDCVGSWDDQIKIKDTAMKTKNEALLGRKIREKKVEIDKNEWLMGSEKRREEEKVFGRTCKHISLNKKISEAARGCRCGRTAQDDSASAVEENKKEPKKCDKRRKKMLPCDGAVAGAEGERCDVIRKSKKRAGGGREEDGGVKSDVRKKRRRRRMEEEIRKSDQSNYGEECAQKGRLEGSESTRILITIKKNKNSNGKKTKNIIERIFGSMKEIKNKSEEEEAGGTKKHKTKNKKNGNKENENKENEKVKTKKKKKNEKKMNEKVKNKNNKNRPRSEEDDWKNQEASSHGKIPKRPLGKARRRNSNILVPLYERKIQLQQEIQEVDKSLHRLKSPRGRCQSIRSVANGPHRVGCHGGLINLTPHSTNYTQAQAQLCCIKPKVFGRTVEF